MKILSLFKRKEKGDPLRYLTERLLKQQHETQKAIRYAGEVERIAKYYISKWSPEDYQRMVTEIDGLR